MTKHLPTKANLLAIKRRRARALSGVSLLEKKQAVLARHLTDHLRRAHALEAQLDTLFTKAYRALQRANILLGHCSQWAETVEPNPGLTLRFYSIMGLELPILTAKETPPTLSYGFTGTDSALDEALLYFTQIKHLLPPFAQAENSAYRLNRAIQKTGKRARALRHLIIPGFDANIRQIEQHLALGEQEAFLRQKRMKGTQEASL